MSTFPFTVVGIYHDNDQHCIQHVMAPDAQQAIGQAQRDVYNEERLGDVADGLAEDCIMDVLAPDEVPDQLHILAVFDGHLSALLSFD